MAPLPAQTAGSNRSLAPRLQNRPISACWRLGVGAGIGDKPVGEQDGERQRGLAEARPHYHGHRARLRKRFLEGSPDTMADYELLEMVLYGAFPRYDTK